MTEPKVCRHCGRRRANRARGLCWTCSTNPEIREQYPSRTANPNGLGSGRWYAPLPPSPTRARPGTAAKLRVLEARAAAGLSLFHPEDPCLEVLPSVPFGIRVVRSPFRVPDG